MHNCFYLGFCRLIRGKLHASLGESYTLLMVDNDDDDNDDDNNDDDDDDDDDDDCGGGKQCKFLCYVCS